MLAKTLRIAILTCCIMPTLANANAYVNIGAGGASSAASFSTYDANGAIIESIKFRQDSFAFIRGELGIKIDEYRLGIEAFIAPYSKMSVSNADTNIINGKISTTAGFINAYYDVHDAHKSITPYIGIGVGAANTKIKNLYYAGNSTAIPLESNTVFAWQVGLGAMLKLTNNVSLDANYFFMDMGSVKGENGQTKVFKQFKRRVHAFSAGLVYAF